MGGIQLRTIFAVGQKRDLICFCTIQRGDLTDQYPGIPQHAATKARDDIFQTIGCTLHKRGINIIFRPTGTAIPYQ